MRAAEHPAPHRLDTADVQQRLDVLAELGHGLLESGETSGQVERELLRSGRALGLDALQCNSFGRMLLLEAALPDGGTTTVTGAARALDAIDCTRSKQLGLQAQELAEPLGAAPRERLAAARDELRRLRDTATPWWAVTLGLTMLALFISMQLGIAWQAWVSAALVQLLASAVGFALVPLRMPRLFSVALQATAGGTFATMLVLWGFADPVGAAAAIAVNWLLLLPLPQVIGAVTDAIDGDYLSSLTRVASVGVAGVGILIGGVLIFALGELLGMEHPRLDALPSLPWPSVLVFSALGAVANAFANGGRLPLVAPAAMLGLVTGAANQFFLLVLGLPALWASSASAVILGGLTGILAARTGYPQQVLALMGITGALLPGIPVFFGILQEMGGASGLASFGTAAAICGGIGIGVSLGGYLVGFSVGDAGPRTRGARRAARSPR